MSSIDSNNSSVAIATSDLPQFPLPEQDQEELLKVMMEESDYVDPPMTRSEYIASLGGLPDLVTTVPYNRLEYFAKASIPSDITPEEYARKGIAAAIASRLPPFALHPLEYSLLKSGINHLHVSTYLNIRNGILFLWCMNHHVTVTRTEAAGCARDPRFFGLAEAAFEFLVRHGYINFGVIDVPRCRNNFPYQLPIPPDRRPRLRIVVIGAGMSGLGCARQLDGLCKQYDDFLTGYEDSPEIVILEARSRIGGRVYSAMLKKDPTDTKIFKVDLGAQIITGFSHGNPMSVLIRKQLGLPCYQLKDAGELYDEVTGGSISRSLDKRAEELFNDMLDRVSTYRAPPILQHTVEGDASFVLAGKDPSGEGGRTIGRMEANSADVPPLEPSSLGSKAALKSLDLLRESTPSAPKMTFGRPYGSKAPQTALDVKLEQLGFSVSKSACSQLANTTTDPLPKGNAPTLGATLDGQLEIVRKVCELTDQDLRLLNWHYANLEYANASAVHNLSLGSWDQDDGNEFAGKHCMVQDGGYMQVPRALYLFPSKLDVRLKSIVKEIKYDSTKDNSRKKYNVVLESGENLSADRVICTLPLGVLKANSVKFTPELPEIKRNSIQNLGFGVLNKVVLVYDHCFWDADSDLIGVARDRNSGDYMAQDSYVQSRGRFYMFWNCTNVVGKYCLVALMAGAAAFETSIQPDNVLIRDATHVLSRMYPHVSVPHPTETIITKWHMDPFAHGAYSYVGPNATGQDYDNLASSSNDDTLFFAGEATSRTHPATVHGAYLSGLRVAEEVFRSIVGDVTLSSPLVKPKPKPNMPLQTETVTFPPPPKSAYVGDVPPPPPKPVVLPQISLEELLLRERMEADGESSNSGAVITKRRKPGPRPRTKTSESSTTSVSGLPRTIQSNGMLLTAPTGKSATSSRSQQGGPSNISRHEGLTHLARYRQLKNNRMSAHQSACDTAVTVMLRHEQPMKPEKAQLNPYIIYQKRNWESCRAQADSQRQQVLRDPTSRAPMADIRALLGQQWRSLTDTQKQEYIDETNRNRIENERRMEEYNKRVAEYEAKVQKFRDDWLQQNPSFESEEEQKELALAKLGGVA
ncbi:flavin-containing amine oxidoreductase-domain containing protein [Lipomyces oligophaga]|uniref:flavin-containing amine oxidoreductase-domain containing protein n=1 Tax=Lipomyces oligophaga TaxID=45792 RepID=UPI0034CE4E09